MKKIIYFLSVSAIIAIIVMVLVFNKRTTATKTQMAANASSAIAVKTMVIKDSIYSPGFSSNGVLKAMHDLQFVSDIAGRIVNIYVDEGSYVNKGEVLLQLDSEILHADFISNEATYNGLKKDYERFKNSNEQGGVSNQQLDNIHTQMIMAESRYITSKRRLADASVKAPISGTIYKRHIEVGSYLNPGTLLFDIINDSQLKATCFVTEKQILEISKGHEVIVASETFPGETFKGKITFIGKKAESSLNFPVEVSIVDHKKELKPGMFVTMFFNTETQKNGIIIPRNAISGSYQESKVFVLENSLAKQRNIVIGEMLDESVVVLQGLQAGDSIITGGLINVFDGAIVRDIR